VAYEKEDWYKEYNIVSLSKDNDAANKVSQRKRSCIKILNRREGDKS